MNVAEQQATPEQRAVIELPCETRAFVVAGPGAGKTWALLRRAMWLADHDGVEPSELLVLSFTRAVVRELRRRDRNAHAFPAIFPETFDSFATRLLERHATTDAWRGGSFDLRIRSATELIREGGAVDELQRVRHILVDEVQDLVGPRAELVEALLATRLAGFTALGDPAQAIYDHAHEGDGASLTSRLEDGLADQVLALPGNHRVDGAPARSVAALRSAVLSAEPRVGFDASLDALADLDSLGDWADLPTMLRTVRGETAILARDNATVLLLSRALHAAGVAHRVRRGTSDRPVAGWVAPLLGRSATLDRDRLAERLDELARCGFPSLPQADEAWRWLSRMDGQARSGSIRVAEVRSRILINRVPYELCDEPDHELVVSSVHRAKGLEFDRCVVIEWPRRDDPEEAEAEARVLFVALSRARTEPLHARPAGSARSRWHRSDEAGGRFIRRGAERWQTFGIEVRGDDVHGLEPAGGPPLDDDPQIIQQRLVRDVRPGDAVTLARIGERDFGRGSRAVYAVEHETGPIGVTGEAFGAALRGRGRRGPTRVRELRVDDLETIAGAPMTSDAAGLGTSGLWLRPRLIGLGEFEWSER